MSAPVVDASFAATWFLPDEANDATLAFAIRAAIDPPIVPTLFRHEMRNLLVIAARRGRLSERDARAQIADLEHFPLVVADPTSVDNVVTLAFRHELTAYDATYLALARERSASFATLDRKLAAAARSEGVSLVGPLGTR